MFVYRITGSVSNLTTISVVVVLVVVVVMVVVVVAAADVFVSFFCCGSLVPLHFVVTQLRNPYRCQA